MILSSYGSLGFGGFFHFQKKALYLTFFRHVVPYLSSMNSQRQLITALRFLLLIAKVSQGKVHLLDNLRTFDLL